MTHVRHHVPRIVLNILIQLFIWWNSSYSVSHPREGLKFLVQCVIGIEMFLQMWSLWQIVFWLTFVICSILSGLVRLWLAIDARTCIIYLPSSNCPIKCWKDPRRCNLKAFVKDGSQLTASQGSEPPCPVSAVILLLVQYAPELTVTQVATSSVSDYLVLVITNSQPTVAKPSHT